jgi:transcriptional antiterminator RfaH
MGWHRGGGSFSVLDHTLTGIDWYCVHAKARKEPQVFDHLAHELELEVYFPRLKRVKRIRRVLRTVVSGLFPRYLFCRFDAAGHFRAVRYAPEVINLVSCGGVPKVVDAAIIDELKQWAGEAVDLVTLQPPLRPGDPVELVCGPLGGLRAVVLQEMPDTARVAILLEALGCGARMVVDRSTIARAP